MKESPRYINRDREFNSVVCSVFCNWWNWWGTVWSSFYNGTKFIFFIY